MDVQPLHVVAARSGHTGTLAGTAWLAVAGRTQTRLPSACPGGVPKLKYRRQGADSSSNFACTSRPCALHASEGIYWRT